MKTYTQFKLLKQFNMISIRRYLLLFAYFCVFSYFFGIVFLNRSGLSIIPNSFLVIYFIVVGLLIIIEKAPLINFGLLFFGIIFALTSISNIINTVFSYNFIILTMIGYSTYMLASLDKNHFFRRLLFSIIIGQGLGLTLIFFHFFVDIITDFSFKDGFFNNLDLTASFASNTLLLIIVYFVSIKHEKSKVFTIGFLIVAVFAAIILISATRLGSYISFFLISTSMLIYFCFTKKNKILFYTVIFILLFLSIFIFLYFIQKNTRFSMVLMQFFDLNIVYEASFRSRILFVLRDILLFLNLPLFGGGEAFIINFNQESSHNMFGDIGARYGLLLFLFFISFIFATAHSMKYIKMELQYYVLWFLILAIYTSFYGMFFTSRFNYFHIGAICFFVDGFFKKKYLFSGMIIMGRVEI